MLQGFQMVCLVVSDDIRMILSLSAKMLRATQYQIKISVHRWFSLQIKKFNHSDETPGLQLVLTDMAQMT